MLISEERLQILLPKELKKSLRKAAHQAGLSIGEYIRRLIELDLEGKSAGGLALAFPFGEHPIHSGRRDGSSGRSRLF